MLARESTTVMALPVSQQEGLVKVVLFIRQSCHAPRWLLSSLMEFNHHYCLLQCFCSFHISTSLYGRSPINIYRVYINTVKNKRFSFLVDVGIWIMRLWIFLFRNTFREVRHEHETSLAKVKCTEAQTSVVFFQLDAVIMLSVHAHHWWWQNLSIFFLCIVASFCCSVNRMGESCLKFANLLCIWGCSFSMWTAGPVYCGCESSASCLSMETCMFS